MSIEKTVSEIAEILGVSRQAVNNRVKQLPEEEDRKSTRLNSSHIQKSRMPSSA